MTPVLPGPNPSMVISSVSLLADLPDDLPEERFETLLETPAFRLERILSLGHATPEGEWYDQAWDEWVMVVQGAARLAIEGRTDPIDLKAGDTLLLPARCRHRVEWTPDDRITVWLALHYRDMIGPWSGRTGTGTSELYTHPRVRPGGRSATRRGDGFHFGFPHPGTPPEGKDV